MGFINELSVPTLNHQQNESLTLLLSEEEVKRAVFDLSPDSAPGPDGFRGKSALKLMLRMLQASFSELLLFRWASILILSV